MQRRIHQSLFIILTCVFSFVIHQPAIAQKAMDSAPRGIPEKKLIATLESDATVLEKQQACRELRVVGTKQSVPVLISMLTDQQLSHHVRYALEPMDYPEVSAGLLQALAKTEGSIKVGIIVTIGVRQDKQATIALIPLLNNNDKLIVGATATALGKISTTDAAKALNQFRNKATGSDRVIAAEASMLVAKQLIGRNQYDEATAIYTDLRKENWPRYIRLGAFTGLLESQPQQAVSLVLDAIKGDDYLLQSTAIASIKNMDNEKAIQRFCDALTDASDELQILLMNALADHGGKAVKQAILKTAKSSNNTNVKTAAIKVLGNIGDASCVDWLVAQLALGQSSAESNAAKKALVMLKSSGVGDKLIVAMSKSDDDMRPQLIGILMKRGEMAAIMPLLEQAGHGNKKISRAAFRALAVLATPQHLNTILELLTQASDPVSRVEAEKTVIQIARKMEDPTHQASAVLAKLSSEKRSSARSSLLKVLGGIGGANALAAVKNAVNDSDAQVRNAAVRALANWPDATAAPSLLAVYQSTKNKVHRALALQGFVRVTSQSKVPSNQTMKQYKQVVANVNSVVEKQLILSGLGHVVDIESMNLAMAWLNDADVQIEAALAAVSVAKSVVVSNPQAVITAMKQVVSTVKNQAIKKQAQHIITLAGQFDDYIVAWIYSGPYRQSGRSGATLYDFAFPPEGAAGQVTPWRLLKVKGRKNQPWMLDLTSIVGGDNCVVYLQTWIISDREQTVQLEIGVDDAVKVYLNGKMTFAHNTAGAAVPGKEKVKFKLNKGPNQLLLKVVQHTGPSEICVRVRTPEGQRASGLQIDPTRQGKIKIIQTKHQPIKYIPSGPWQSLFNGKDIKGWSQTGNGIFKVEEACLTGTQTDGKGGDLWLKGQWTDFELKAMYRVDWPANSGLWYRWNGKSGYQYDILKWKNPVGFSGTLYCPEKVFIFANLKESLENRDKWNELKIRAAGQQITHWLNGTITGTVTDNTHQKGQFGIQVHGGDGFKGMKIYLKKLEARPLVPAPEKK